MNRMRNPCLLPLAPPVIDKASASPGLAIPDFTPTLLEAAKDSQTKVVGLAFGKEEFAELDEWLNSGLVDVD